MASKDAAKSPKSSSEHLNVPALDISPAVNTSVKQLNIKTDTHVDISGPPSPAGSTHSNASFKIVDGSKRSTRSSADSVPADLIYRIRSQKDRLDSLYDLVAQLESSGPTAGLAAYEHWSAILMEVFAEFKWEHTRLETGCPAVLLHHDYFTQRSLFNAQQAYSEASFKLGLLTERLQAEGKFRCSNPPVAHSTSYAKLPEIRLVEFSGSYSDWPAYKELFNSMVNSNERLTDRERLHYLRTSLAQEPLQLIQGLPVCNESFAAAWKILEKHYENKRFIIHSHMDTLISLQPAQSKNIGQLNKLVITFTKVRQALITLVSQEQLADLLLSVHLVRLLDRPTREAWETHCATLEEDGSFSQLQDFVVSRIRALERVDGRESRVPAALSSRPVRVLIGGFQQQRSTQSSPQPAATCTTHQRSNQSASTQSSTQSSTQPPQQRAGTTYPCVLCSGEGHFIVNCSRFRDLSLMERRKVVEEKRLCYHCLGNHSVGNCRSTIKYKTCGGNNHTMIHQEDSRRTTDVKTLTSNH